MEPYAQPEAGRFQTQDFSKRLRRQKRGRFLFAGHKNLTDQQVYTTFLNLDPVQIVETTHQYQE
ncbi:hypothetical protein BAR24_16375 [Gluconobacter oxydans]|uniref:Transposase n=1 Tax=Gluconobacter thailandicus NBRC 3257 TaxID=1381097 RepID=A0ABQ0ITQ4_GLUTH|nr:hypothetical protein B932_1896 [Gluconobacter oxydans H24]ANQ43172.1 hypothetical protein BAR24_16375 [Gluconobacter oxydans]KXV54078.1 hypothetical protein AD946_04870 [Gluconobacter thailandicus]GAC88850.1 hypothetical protein NBRC3255_2511 [Gluconobacter thailandicus NBRC 3255]GAD25599.1 hypothetical protein NBRC3257_0598 [Gluconobacter thailandicus NBRC 3257]